MWVRWLARIGLVLCAGIVITLVVVLIIGQEMATTLIIRACIVVPFVALWSIRELRKP